MFVVRAQDESTQQCCPSVDRVETSMKMTTGVAVVAVEDLLMDVPALW